MLKRIGILIGFLLLAALPAHAKISLTSTSDQLQMVTASAVSTIHVHVDWADITSTAVSGGRTNTLATTATTTTIASPPAASTVRQIKGVTIYNSHATASNVTTLQHYDGTTTAIIYKYTLLAGEVLHLDEEGAIRVVDSLGNVRALAALRTPNGDTMVDDTNDALRVTGVTTQAVSGNIAHDSLESQAPVVVGGHATSSIAGETIVTSGDAVRWHFERDGTPVVTLHCAKEDLVAPVVATITDTTNTSIVAAAGAGLKNYLHGLVVVNTSATTVYATIRDGAAGTTRAIIPIPGNTTGTIWSPPVPISGFSANTAIYFQASASANALYVTPLSCKSQL